MRLVQWARMAVTGACVAVLAFVAPQATSAEPLPSSLAGAWRITRVLPTGKAGCWSPEQARDLVGTTLFYSTGAMRWRDGEVPLAGIVTRELSAAQFQKENSGAGGGVNFAQLGIRSPRVLEVDLQHEDMDITGASTEVPGDSVLVAAPNRIVVSACGVFLEATRTEATRTEATHTEGTHTAGSGNLLRTSARH